MKDENEKKHMQRYFEKIDKSLQSAKDTCQAGLVFQTIMYQIKKLIAQSEWKI